MRLFILILLISISTFIYSNENIINRTFPSWVEKIDVEYIEATEENSGYQYLLINRQDNLITESEFRHFAIKVTNADGIQSMSDININYDPAFQNLHIHQLRIIRNEQIIDKLNNTNVQVIQRETSLERSIYDGTLSAVINLTDVRVNDIIEYSYSTIGFNPINNGNFHKTYYQQYSVPVNRTYTRLLSKPGKIKHIKEFDGAAKPVVKNLNNVVEYIWDVNSIKYILYDNNTPSWYDNQKRVSVSTYLKWKDVVNWALPLYKYNKDEIAEISGSFENPHNEQKILDIIRFVQDDIRYLGFESGISAYKPHNPTQVFNQRYGDCKDKTLLLVSLLRSENIEAYPLLVNSQLRQSVKNLLPSHNIFNHSVVYFEYNEKKHFIDPTISNQGGSLDNISFPNYKQGLLIKPGQTGLIHIPDGTLPQTKITEEINIESIGDDGELTVLTEFSGSKADFIRSYFNNNTRESIQKEYLNYYSNLYPNIEIKNDIEFDDSNRNTSNKIIVKEYYKINELWLTSDDKSSIYCEAYPLVLESLTNYPNSAERKMPYSLGYPYSFTQDIIITLPEEWNVTESDLTIESTAFNYSSLVKSKGNKIFINYKYDLKKNVIAGDSTESFLTKNQEIQNDLAFYLSYNESLNGFSLSWGVVSLALIIIIIASFFAIKTYKSYNPKPINNLEADNIGGWLILPAIGLTFTPFMIVYQIFNQEYFNQNTWLGLINLEGNQSLNLLFMYGAEMIYNVSFLVFSVLVLFLFYQRRSSLPNLITAFYLLSFVVPLVDTLLIEQIAPGQLINEETNILGKDIIRSFIAAAIWIPYFNISVRVKRTFTFSYKKIE